jgi:hypothetical protein
MAKKKSAPRTAKAKKSSLNAPSTASSSGAPFSEQDAKRRLGNFGGTGEHPRQGGRTTGIVGQTKQRNKTDKGPNK